MPLTRFFWVALFMLYACNADLTPSVGLGDLQPSRNPIINGAPPVAPEHAAVVGLHQVQGAFVYTKPLCSGTLVAPDIVLTAAHCLAKSAASQVAVYVGDDPSRDLLSSLFAVSEIKVHPDDDRVALGNDIALARLASPVTSVAPTPFLPSARGLSAADVGTRLNSPSAPAPTARRTASATAGARATPIARRALAVTAPASSARAVMAGKERSPAARTAPGSSKASRRRVTVGWKVPVSG